MQGIQEPWSAAVSTAAWSTRRRRHKRCNGGSPLRGDSKGWRFAPRKWNSVEKLDSLSAWTRPDSYPNLPLMEADPWQEALKVIDSLNRHGVDYVVIGGVAVNVHGMVRATEDLDFFVRPSTENIARLRDALRDVWNDPSIEEISADDLCGEFPAVRYGPPSGSLFLDIATRFGEAVSFEDLEAMDVDVEGTRIRVATPKTLYWMKRDTVRAIDKQDALLLREAFHLDEDADSSRGSKSGDTEVP